MNTPNSIRGILFHCLTVTLAALTTAQAHSGDAGTYTQVPESFIYCTTCHGVELRGNESVDAPRLNGMEDWYLRSQMNAFANGWRGTHADDLIGMEMQPQAAALDEKQREAAAAFVASVPVRTDTLRVTVTADAARGASLYTSCAACHGERGEGNATLQAPGLAGQSDWYLVRQLDKYRAGSRGYVPEDIQGMQMRAAAAVLVSPEDVRDLVAYINSFSTAANQPTQESP